MKRRTYLATVSAALASVAGCAGRGGTDTNYVFTTPSELSAVSDIALSGINPWASAWRELQQAADAALDAPLASVVDDDDDHEFNLDTNGRHDYRAAIRMGSHARDTALAYFVTGRDEYAQKAIDVIYHWTTAPETYMLPTGGSGPGGNPEQFVTLPKLWYAASLVRDHDYWQTKGSDMPWRNGTAIDAEVAFQRWIRDYLENVENDYGNNIYIRWLVCKGSAYAYLQDPESFNSVVEQYRGTQAWNDYNDCTTDKEGTFEREIHRSKPLSYQVVRMKAHLHFCELARHQGYDLYSYNAPTDSCEGSTIRTSLDAMLPFFRNPSQWNYLGKRLNNDWLSGIWEHATPSVYELAYSRWQDDSYRELIEMVATRPVTDNRLLGWITFTHGNLFELSDWCINIGNLRDCSRYYRL